ncbi:hypothetical protein [Chromobacterium vaccinii]|uniref:hypothetical protein n=1 Tax=Chromobacterium vaccinii TaxID=1108595 RepID=UPI0019101559|nr:hypothetical protein [Chromobacterium vaccinii]
MTPRIPTLQEFLVYKGAHTHRLWEQVGPLWICPSCKRTKFQVLRWTTRNPNTSHAFKDWIAPLHKHHDHSGGFMSDAKSRFPETIICDQCNAADGAAKRKLKLPKLFSFSRSEIAVFVVATPHGKHTIDYEIANAIFQAINLSSPVAHKWPHSSSETT